MSDSERNPFARGQLEKEAADWFLRMREPDAEQHRAEFERWLARGAMHRAAYNGFAHTYLVAGAVNWDNLPPPRPVRGAVTRTRFALAASLMLLAFLAWRFIIPPTYLSEPEDRQSVVAEARASTQFVTRLGEVRRIRLSDGSILTLDTDTLVSVDYRAEERELRLEHGRARFEVAHEGRPFVVEAGDSEVIARGTVFDVSLLEPGDVHVHLLRGKVEVRRRQHGQQREMVRFAVLQPGQGLRFADTPSPDTPNLPHAEPSSNWPSGLVDFEHATLGEVIEAANRYSVRKIRLATPDIERIPVSGVFRVNDPDRLLASLSLLFDLEVTQGTGEIILTRAGK